ncbi:MAG TPA: hypothetical protein VNK41_02465, partial [Vicinamibacterales bacterium]|nr:hypothetical protein [Vicinamibacterales bacterium]
MSSAVDQTVAAGDRFVAEFEARTRDGSLGGPAWLREARAGAMQWFAEVGFPTTRLEDWRFTPIAPIASTAFVPAERLLVAPAAIEPYVFGEEFAAELVFVNGWFVPALSRVDDLPAGLAVGTLADRLERDPAR